jgi:hypothetical protein
MPLQDAQNNDHAQQQLKSDSDVPIDPTIAAAQSPTAYPQHGQYTAAYQQHTEMHGYQAHPTTPMYAQRPEWAGGQQQPHYPLHYPHSSSAAQAAPSMVSNAQRPPTGGHALSTVYSFVPIPGAQQHKRPRRRYEEIERMYKCGWNGCEKAYGTLNHLNAHVTMQAHGNKRTPEEFKEIRKEWKAKKKEEDAQRKLEEERHRTGDSRVPHDNGADGASYGAVRQPVGMPGQTPGHQTLPPLGYQPAATGEGMTPHYPQSPYGGGPNIYQQGH